MTRPTERTRYDPGTDPFTPPYDPLIVYEKIREALKAHAYPHLIASAFSIAATTNNHLASISDRLAGIQAHLATLNSHGIPALMACAGDLSDRERQRHLDRDRVIEDSSDSIVTAIRDLVDATRTHPR